MKDEEKLVPMSERTGWFRYGRAAVRYRRTFKSQEWAYWTMAALVAFILLLTVLTVFVLEMTR